jgi:hypothetical protein
MAVIYYLILFLVVSSCGKSDLYNQLELAARKQESIDQLTQEIFELGPVESSGNSSLNATSDLDTVQRDKVVFEGMLDIMAPLESKYLKVFESEEKTSEAPSFFEWAGRRISWKDPEFQIFMAYYHGHKAQTFLESAVGKENLNWNFVVNTGSGFATKTNVMAVEEGSPFQTGYDVSEKTIRFFRDPESDLPRYNPVDEGTAVYHEFGHVAMQAIRAEIVEMPLGENQDLDALQEGLADFVAAAISNKSDILTFFTNNAFELISETNRNGRSQIRVAQNELFFPRAYTGQINLDGRVISGALNDFKRYLEGAPIRQLSQCNGAQACAIPARSTSFDSVTAYKKSVKLGLLAFGDLVDTSTLHAYAKFLLAKCQSSPDICSAPTDRTVLQKILLGRGLLQLNEVPVTTLSQYTFGAVGSSEDFQMSLDIGVMPFPNESLANLDERIDPCEVLLIFPKVSNKSGFLSGRTPLEIRNWKINLGAVEGFQPVLNGSPPRAVEVIPSLGSSAKAEEKTWGWMSPTENDEDSSNIINAINSPWNRDNLGSPFTQRLSSTFFPSPLGWLVKAPSTPSTVVRARFRFEFQPANSETMYILSHDRGPTLEDDYFKPNGTDFPSLAVADPAATQVTFCPSSN